MLELYSLMTCVTSLLTQIKAFKYWKSIFSNFCAIHDVIVEDSTILKLLCVINIVSNTFLPLENQNNNKLSLDVYC